MPENMNPTAQKLMTAFKQFHSIRKKSPVTDLKSSEVWVLFCIKKRVSPDSPGIKVSDISSALHVAAPTITQLINSLDANGYVERATDKEDRRAVRIRLTDKGEQAMMKASESFSESFNGLVDYLGEEKGNELAELLSMVFTYFDEQKKDNF